MALVCSSLLNDSMTAFAIANSILAWVSSRARASTTRGHSTGYSKMLLQSVHDSSSIVEMDDDDSGATGKTAQAPLVRPSAAASATHPVVLAGLVLSARLAEH